MVHLLLQSLSGVDALLLSRGELDGTLSDAEFPLQRCRSQEIMLTSCGFDFSFQVFRVSAQRNRRFCTRLVQLSHRIIDLLDLVLK